jgi:DNA-binding NarL/FixJ family response regulator
MFIRQKVQNLKINFSTGHIKLPDQVVFKNIEQSFFSKFSSNEMNMEPVHVMVFEDENLTREMLKDLINSTENFICSGAYADARDLTRKIKSATPAIVLMDIEMPGVNGIDAVRLIHDEFKDIRVVMQTVHDEDEQIFQSICAGACGYLLKGASGEKIIEALNDALNGGAPFSPGVATRILNQFRKQSPQYSQTVVSLTVRETEILQGMAEGMSNKQIADKCFISSNTVKFHIRNIYEKLHVHSKSGAVAAAIKRNII